MTLEDLTHPEKIALVGLARLMVRADREFSREEAGALDALAAELGEDEFWRLADEAAELDDEAIKACAREVTPRPARELIYGALYQLATAGTIVNDEAAILDWVADAWDVSVTVEPDGPQED